MTVTELVTQATSSSPPHSPFSITDMRRHKRTMQKPVIRVQLYTAVCRIHRIPSLVLSPGFRLTVLRHLHISA
ncbi:hypothetical protein SNOG_00994 [Parastagonospora nodorum SN15]|uniref:Uncharacterized protein n=1 Tax=Phaeosphaeria nodorum (strain SN15 / ATCC MYA-4574 / FGSC 10173) TaxID=321614 RepID=Q0V4S0_PHANO|nr:hypothetical protein SNOG_00994 [Parastagonospora nodorum SN15]EAT92489.1 hypothetical protein SNOG_00994 [Parastagonospora nodorum SN15]